MFSAFRWPIWRTGRRALFAWLLLGSLGFPAIKLALFGLLDPIIRLGFRLEALGKPDQFPLWYLIAEAVFDLLLAVVAIARLHDFERPGWWLAGMVAPTGIVALAELASVPGAALLQILLLPLWLALLLWPGSFGRNRYGADPLGWETREQFETQMRELREASRPRRIPG